MRLGCCKMLLLAAALRQKQGIRPKEGYSPADCTAPHTQPCSCLSRACCARLHLCAATHESGPALTSATLAAGAADAAAADSARAEGSSELVGMDCQPVRSMIAPARRLCNLHGRDSGIPMRHIWESERGSSARQPASAHYSSHQHCTL